MMPGEGHHQGKDHLSQEICKIWYPCETQLVFYIVDRIRARGCQKIPNILETKSKYADTCGILNNV